MPIDVFGEQVSRPQVCDIVNLGRHATASGSALRANDPIMAEFIKISKSIIASTRNSPVRIQSEYEFMYLLRAIGQANQK
jgi:hypothetical protein